MSNPVESKSPGGDLEEVEAQPAQIDHTADLDEKAALAAYKPDAIEAENAEHRMGVLEAVRLYPMATFWAFIMSSTIVSDLSRYLASRS
jgi:SP family general alpha glucoside:H+ symporter-like MFS transporter